MNSKTFFSIVGILVVLIVVWVGMRFMGDTTEDISLSDVGIGSVTAEDVEVVVIEDGDTRIELRARDDAWMVDDFIADPAKIALIWSSFADLEVSGPVSRNTVNHGRFGVSDEDFSVVFRKGDHEKRLRIGTQATAFDTTYVRNAQHDEVYVVSTNLRALFSTEVADWRDRTIIRTTPEVLTAIEVEQGGTVVRLEKDEIGAWVIPSDEDVRIADEEAVARLFANLNPLDARAFVDAEGVGEFARRRVDAAVRLFGDDDTLLQQLDLVEEGDYWWARLSGDETVFDVQKYKLADVLVSEEVLLGEGEEGVESEESN